MENLVESPPACSASAEASTSPSHEAILTAAACRHGFYGTFLSPYAVTEPACESMYSTFEPDHGGVNRVYSNRTRV